MYVYLLTILLTIEYCTHWKLLIPVYRVNKPSINHLLLYTFVFKQLVSFFLPSPITFTGLFTHSTSLKSFSSVIVIFSPRNCAPTFYRIQFDGCTRETEPRSTSVGQASMETTTVRIFPYYPNCSFDSAFAIRGSTGKARVPTLILIRRSFQWKLNLSGRSPRSTRFPLVRDKRIPDWVNKTKFYHTRWGSSSRPQTTCAYAVPLPFALSRSSTKQNRLLICRLP